MLTNENLADLRDAEALLNKSRRRVKNLSHPIARRQGRELIDGIQDWIDAVRQGESDSDEATNILAYVRRVW